MPCQYLLKKFFYFFAPYTRPCVSCAGPVQIRSKKKEERTIRPLPRWRPPWPRGMPRRDLRKFHTSWCCLLSSLYCIYSITHDGRYVNNFLKNFCMEIRTRRSARARIGPGAIAHMFVFLNKKIDLAVYLLISNSSCLSKVSRYSIASASVANDHSKPESMCVSVYIVFSPFLTLCLYYSMNLKLCQYLF